MMGGPLKPGFGLSGVYKGHILTLANKTRWESPLTLLNYNGDH